MNNCFWPEYSSRKVTVFWNFTIISVRRENIDCDTLVLHTTRSITLRLSYEAKYSLKSDFYKYIITCSGLKSTLMYTVTIAVACRRYIPEVREFKSKEALATKRIIPWQENKNVQLLEKITCDWITERIFRTRIQPFRIWRLNYLLFEIKIWMKLQYLKTLLSLEIVKTDDRKKKD